MTVEETQELEVIVSEQDPKMAIESEVKVLEKIANENEEGVVEKSQSDEDESKPTLVEKSSSYREESNYLSDLKESERKALIELKSKLEEAILGNSLFKSSEKKEKVKEKEAVEVKEEKTGEETGMKTEEKTEEETGTKTEEKTEEETGEKAEEETVQKEEGKSQGNEDVSIWGVPLLPSKSSEGTDVVLLKFLRARDFKVNEAFEMLKKTLLWRESFNVEGLLEEELGAELANAAYMNGFDRDKHPVCYNIFGVFSEDELYQKTFGSEEKREQFLRWRFQFMEKGIQKLDFRPAGVSSILQVYDLKNCPGPSKSEIRSATFKAVGLLQDNYPELVAKNVFINVPFWYYAFYSLISPFLTQRSKSKFVVARPAKVIETLLKYIPFEEIPIQYGGMKRENDHEFEEAGSASEIILKPGATETIEIPAPDVGNRLIWDLAVLGWEVSYKEEFIPTDEGSYTIIIHKEKKMQSTEAAVRNSFRNNEAGKVVLTINNSSKKKKRGFYRYKTQKSSSL